MAPHADIDFSDGTASAQKAITLRGLLQRHGHYRKSKYRGHGCSALHSKEAGNTAKIDDEPTVRSPYLWRLSSEEIGEVEEAVRFFQGDRLVL